jgi:hypothetical protein
MKKSEFLFKQLNALREDYLTEVNEEMNEKNIKPSSKLVKRFYIVAAALIVLIAVPNVSPVFANALGEIPVIGNFFQIVTINKIVEEDGLSSIEAETPYIINDNASASITEVNTSVETYTNKLIEIFKEENGTTSGSIDISYKVITNTDQWFTLLISSTEIQASGYERSRYYNIDKSTDKYVLFSDYVVNFDSTKNDIKEYITSTMLNEMKEDENISYFIESIDESGFESIAANQDYYFNEDGVLVLSFDEYEVAPGCMGIVQFMIPAEVYSK